MGTGRLSVRWRYALARRQINQRRDECGEFCPPLQCCLWCSEGSKSWYSGGPALGWSARNIGHEQLFRCVGGSWCKMGCHRSFRLSAHDRIGYRSSRQKNYNHCKEFEGTIRKACDDCGNRLLQRPAVGNQPLPVRLDATAHRRRCRWLFLLGTRTDRRLQHGCLESWNTPSVCCPRSLPRTETYGSALFDGHRLGQRHELALCECTHRTSCQCPPHPWPYREGGTDGRSGDICHQHGASLHACMEQSWTRYAQHLCASHSHRWWNGFNWCGEYRGECQYLSGWCSQGF